MDNSTTISDMKKLLARMQAKRKVNCVTTFLLYLYHATLPLLSINQASMSMNSTSIYNATYPLPDNSSVAFSFDLEALAFNLNAKYSVFYSNTTVLVAYRGLVLAYQALSHALVAQPGANVSLATTPLSTSALMNAHLRPNGSVLRNGSDVVGEPERVARVASEVADLGVVVQADAWFKAKKRWREFHVVVEATCTPIPMRFTSSSRARSLRPTPCSVGLYLRYK